MSTATSCDPVIVHIRWMITRDMREVVEIERAGFEHAWTEQDFLSCLRSKNCIGMVAERGDGVVGFVVYETHKSRLHLLNLAVRPDYRRRGVGTQAVAKLVGKLSARRRPYVTADVDEANLAAQLFFRARGFLAVNVLRGHYADTGNDAYRMVYALDRPPDAQEGGPRAAAAAP